MLRRKAVEVFIESLSHSDRILVLGAGGWFGQTALRILEHSSHKVMATTLRPRTIHLSKRTQALESFNKEKIIAFEPTVVLDFAFLTQKSYLGMSDQEYERTNLGLLDNLYWACDLPSTRLVLAVSSGAALNARRIALESNAYEIYGRLKAEMEKILQQKSSNTAAKIRILRAWSMSGFLCQNPDKFAFSSFALQASSGVISIRSNHEVYRRFTLVEDALAVALSSGNGNFGLIDSGGEKVELMELANIFKRLTYPALKIQRTDIIPGLVEDYTSDNSSWSSACDDIGFHPASLEEQVRASLNF